jgi:hypothetical protein
VLTKAEKAEVIAALTDEAEKLGATANKWIGPTR